VLSTGSAMTTQLRREAEIDGYEAAAEARDAITATYDAIARLIGGRSDEVALFDNATHAWPRRSTRCPFAPATRS
jgi:selenocysteine lyase/cysteine desulfurase